MDKKEELEIIKDMQLVVEQMRIDDIVNNPASELEEFQCDCCAKQATKAGSMIYNGQLFCNECVLYAETAMALGKIKSPNEIIDLMEDKKLEELCNYIKEEEARINN